MCTLYTYIYKLDGSMQKKKLIIQLYSLENVTSTCKQIFCNISLFACNHVSAGKRIICFCWEIYCLRKYFSEWVAK